jgi:hypothetical protein
MRRLCGIIAFFVIYLLIIFYGCVFFVNLGFIKTTKNH